jgi:hypothetical protein
MRISAIQQSTTLLPFQKHRDHCPMIHILSFVKYLNIKTILKREVVKEKLDNKVPKVGYSAIILPQRFLHH